jgi:electron transfer flavoprotein beta subunit
MKIAVMVKVLPDDQDIDVTSERKLDFSKAKPTISTYDLNAMEAAARLAAETDSSVSAISVGPAYIDDSKTKKNILSRGIDDLYLVADDAYEMADAYQTAQALAALVEKAGGVDLIICGDGSADFYAQQVDVQLAEKLGYPAMNSVVAIHPEQGAVVVDRILENEKESVRLSLPAIISVSPDIAIPRIAGMKDILAAGKKPVTPFGVSDLGGVAPETVNTVEVFAPEPAARKKELFDASQDGDIDKFVAALTEAL